MPADGLERAIVPELPPSCCRPEEANTLNGITLQNCHHKNEALQGEEMDHDVNFTIFMCRLLPRAPQISLFAA